MKEIKKGDKILVFRNGSIIRGITISSNLNGFVWVKFPNGKELLPVQEIHPFNIAYQKELGEVAT